MKKRFLKQIAVAMAVVCLSLPACTEKDDHTHTFNLQNTKSDYLKSEATCLSPAFYYYSCECGKIFENSEGIKEISDINLFGNLDRLTEHKEVGRNGKCTECGAVIEPINDVTKTAGICILIGTSLIVTVIASRKRRK